MTVEILKEIIRMFLAKEKEVYKDISIIGDIKKDALVSIEVIERAMKHLDLYDSTFEIILNNLESQKNVKKSSKVTRKM